MRLEDLKGKLILFKFSQDIKSDLSLFQIFKDELWAVVTGVENMGVWIENPSYELGVWWDEEGNLIPPSQQKLEKVRADILIPWHYIKALMNVEDNRFQMVKSDKLPGFHSYK